MKSTFIALGCLYLLLGGCKFAPENVHIPTRISAEDVRFVWARASGPGGERNAEALPLYTAVINGDLKAVTELLDRGISPNKLLYPKRWSALIVAISLQNREMIDLLLKRGADINYVSEVIVAHTPLQVALTADKNAYLSGGFFPKPYLNPMVKYILDKGADVNTPYLEAGDSEDFAITAAGDGNMNIVNDLIARGYNRDLPELLITLKIRVVNEENQPGKDKAISTILQLLSHPEHRSEIPALIIKIRALVANEQPRP